MMKRYVSAVKAWLMAECGWWKWSYNTKNVNTPDTVLKIG